MARLWPWSSVCAQGLGTDSPPPLTDRTCTELQTPPDRSVKWVRYATRPPPAASDTIGLDVTASVAGSGAAAAGAAVEAAQASAVSTAPATPTIRPTRLRVATRSAAHQPVELPNWRPCRMSIAQNLAHPRQRRPEQR